MKTPIITGNIDRRILINYQVDAEVTGNCLPKPFRPKLVKGKAIVGICLIRLKEIRPKGIPKQIGIYSENGAHRIAVEWNDNGEMKEGVYIPRRDTSSMFNSLAGGRIFPGIHSLANFDFEEKNGNYRVQFKSEDGSSLSIEADETKQWSELSVFESLETASNLFENGAVGYSPIKLGECFEGLELKTTHWKVTPLEVKNVFSSFFDNKKIFPEGSVKFDNALLMKNIEHDWKSIEQIKHSK